MTIAQVLAQVDALTPNAYTTAEKLRWLSEAEGFITADLLAPLGKTADFREYDENTNTATVLQAASPYDVLYRYYLEMQIHYANNEMNRANNAKDQWNNTILAYQNYLSRNRCTERRAGVLRLC